MLNVWKSLSFNDVFLYLFVKVQKSTWYQLPLLKLHVTMSSII